MNQQKSPGGHQGEREGNKNDLFVLYPTTATSTSGHCPGCLYYRLTIGTQHTPFCAFTGERELPVASCHFFTGGGGTC